MSKRSRLEAEHDERCDPDYDGDEPTDADVTVPWEGSIDGDWVDEEGRGGDDAQPRVAVEPQPDEPEDPDEAWDAPDDPVFDDEDEDEEDDDQGDAVLTASTGLRVICAWCDGVLRPGLGVPSHGICAACAAAWDGGLEGGLGV